MISLLPRLLLLSLIVLVRISAIDTCSDTDGSCGNKEFRGSSDKNLVERLERIETQFEEQQSSVKQAASSSQSVLFNSFLDNKLKRSFHKIDIDSDYLGSLAIPLKFPNQVCVSHVFSDGRVKISMDHSSNLPELSLDTKGKIVLFKEFVGSRLQKEQTTQEQSFPVVTTDRSRKPSKSVGNRLPTFLAIDEHEGKFTARIYFLTLYCSRKLCFGRKVAEAPDIGEMFTAFINEFPELSFEVESNEIKNIDKLMDAVVETIKLSYVAYRTKGNIINLRSLTNGNSNEIKLPQSAEINLIRMNSETLYAAQPEYISLLPLIKAKNVSNMQASTLVCSTEPGIIVEEIISLNRDKTRNIFFALTADKTLLAFNSRTRNKHSRRLGCEIIWKLELSHYEKLILNLYDKPNSNANGMEIFQLGDRLNIRIGDVAISFDISKSFWLSDAKLLSGSLIGSNVHSLSVAEIWMIIADDSGVRVLERIESSKKPLKEGYSWMSAVVGNAKYFIIIIGAALFLVNKMGGNAKTSRTRQQNVMLQKGMTFRGKKPITGGKRPFGGMRMPMR